MRSYEIALRRTLAFLDNTPLSRGFATLLLATSFFTAGLSPNVLANQEYVTGVRIDAPAEVRVDEVVAIQVRFTDSSGSTVAPEPGRTINIAPSAVFPCMVQRCASTDYTETFVTAPGQDVYTVYVRSLVEGSNGVRITHPNGSTAQALLVSRSSLGPTTLNATNNTVAAPVSQPSAGTPSQFQLVGDTPRLQLGSCTAVSVTLRDAAGNIAALNNARDVTLNPGGGVHVSTDQCASYRNDPVSLAPGSTEFTLYGYVVSEYGGLGAITLSASGMTDLRIPFAAGNSAAQAPVAPQPVAAPAPVVSPPAPTTAPTPEPVNIPSSTNVVVWANDGGEKIIQEETRSFTQSTNNSLWDGTTIRTFGARNEVISFNVIVDNRGPDLSAVRVDFDRLDSANYALTTTNSNADTVFDWRTRPIEVFSVGYLRIHGLSRIAYELYDETHTPESFRRPYRDLQPQAPAIGSGTWFDRPHHGTSYPDIAIPQEVQPQTVVRSGNSQSFWVDIYLPKDVPAGVLRGTVRVTNAGTPIANLPVEVTVADFTLKDESKAKSMVFLGDTDLAERYFTGPGAAGSLPQSSYPAYRQVVDRHFMLAWRHRVSLIDGNALVAFSTTPTDAPNEDWQKRLLSLIHI